MSQEARNTERHANGWGDTKLRDHRVIFVSAGNLTRQEPELANDTEQNLVENEAVKDSPETRQDTLPDLEDTLEITEHLGKAALSDPVRQEVDKKSQKQPVSESKKRRESSSSESSEEIIFAGRLKSNLTPNIPSSPSSVPSRSPLRNPESTVTAAQPASHPLAQVFAPPNPVAIQLRRTVDRRGRSLIRNSISNDEEAIMEDYIANMAIDDDDDDDDDEDEIQPGPAGRTNEHYRFYDSSAEANMKVQTMNLGPNPRPSRRIDQAIDWDSSDLDDFDDLSTTDDEVNEVSQVLRHRTRPAGSQYLVTAVGHGASDAKWVLRQKLTSHSALAEIRIYEEIRAMKVQETSGDTDLDDDDSVGDVLDDLIDDVESEDDENNRIMKHTARMTDEQIARALAKQEELGMGGDEILLFNGQVDGGGGDDEDEDDDDELASAADFIPFSLKKHISNRAKSKRNRRGRDTFPPAEAFADALEQDPYGAFDIMDFDRPSLRPKKKGRKADLPFELGTDDPDLEAQLRNSWNKDREKKASRKREKIAEREGLLLESAERSSPAAIKAEIRQFLIQEGDTLRLAPMDSALRASVHRLAKALKLHSRSEGKEGQGAGRFPVLTKSPNTPVYTIHTVWEIDALLNTRKFFPRHGGGSYRGPNAPRTPAVRERRGGGGVMSGATYMNGEVVGASAPEIGSDNKGRAMLEKMGWSSGMGIGAVGNKGGIDVIKHIVKTTKAGLG
ncbi:uncharacterized protein A1O9_10044 [Exophiala aquamarina CBS 119918]|uniref:G-patch domain-containing protein n=1 Tax=Exophiala aquamarina CBS 119918 TaxID=1182545 RepID=A0A072P0H9_9EURO|nr:uncharacterized protein A1O9_10044 [Exophiala aquamarina CBS 119918]KEF53644.1 hypothetical protein A1O9_10044 [Exophiala aquamarina CBS 119918]